LAANKIYSTPRNGPTFSFNEDDSMTQQQSLYMPQSTKNQTGQECMNVFGKGKRLPVFTGITFENGKSKNSKIKKQKKLKKDFKL
jgi:hypothetical protein